MTDIQQLKKQIIDYWDHQPCNIKHSSSPIGTSAYFNEVTTKRYKAEPHIIEFAEFNKWKNKRVLEIGCGIGTDAEQFARHGAHYTGIDISEESLKISKKRFEIFNLTGSFLCGSVSDLPFLSKLGKFDLVYSFGVLHHFPDVQGHIDNISTLLDPKGEVRFMVYAKNSWKYAMIKKGVDQFEAQSNCPYAEVFTEDDIIKLLKDKFLIDYVKQAHCFMYNVDLYKQGQFKLEPWFESMSSIMREAIKEYLGWHLLVRATKK